MEHGVLCIAVFVCRRSISFVLVSLPVDIWYVKSRDYGQIKCIDPSHGKNLVELISAVYFFSRI